MFIEDKTLNNILTDMKTAAGAGTGTREGTLVDHSLRGAAAEFEQAYIGLWMVEQNGYAQTADRAHLVLRASERGLAPYPATNAVWQAEFNMDPGLGARFSAGELTYRCIEQTGVKTYRLMCEQVGIKGNTRQGELTPVIYIKGFESGELTELLIPARDEEGTEEFRARYLAAVSEAEAFGGNRAQYKSLMHRIEGVGACKIYRVTHDDRRIRICFLDSGYKTPNQALVEDVQEIIDPIGKQGEGEGEAPVFHFVDILPCRSEPVNIETEITTAPGWSWEDLLPEIREQADACFLESAKNWENEDRITVRILKVNAAIAAVPGIIDVQNTTLNGKQENLLLGRDEIPVRGEITCRPSS